MIIMDHASGSGRMLSSGDMSQKASRPSVHRRRSSKGLIALESRGASSASSGTGDTTVRGAEETNASNNNTSGNVQQTRRPINNEPASVDNKSSVSTLSNPCCSARLALSCVQNAIQMGIMTKVFLCPQGRARKSLLTQARLTKNKANLTVEEERFLNNNNPSSASSLDVAEEDGFSSGDDDDYDRTIEEDGVGGGVGPNNKSKALQHIITARNREPYFVPTGPDASSIGMQGGQVPGITGSSSKLPFNYKKLKYFDAVTAADRAVARNFLRREINDANKSYSKALVNHLKNNEQQKQQQQQPNVQQNDNDDPLNDVKITLSNVMSRFPHELTPELSAALVIESLSINHHESIEGMAKCYDGIVSAGMALLDIAANDTTTTTTTAIDATTGSNKQQPKLSTSEIMAALTPLLVTTLEQPSGEVLTALATLRNFCGTRRYQRRFVQRIAPFLVRPPGAAIWCLRHQGDIEAIIAAIEMILDNAFDVFSTGWYERGRNILKDTHRAESLRSAASQLRSLNSPSPSGGLLVGLLTPGLHRRGGHSAASGFGSFGNRRDSVTNDSLEEWEVLAIDDHIRHSVMDLLSRDWSRIGTLSVSMKDSSDTPYGRRRGISASKSKEWQDVSSTASLSAKSPRTINNSKLPLSPRNATLPGATTTTHLPSADALESTFGPSFSSQIVIEDSEPSPTNFSPPSAPSSPSRESYSKPGTPKTPPSHFHDFSSSTDRLSMPNLQEQKSSGSRSISSDPLSPGSRSREMGNVPLSPQSSVGGSSSGLGSHRPASMTPSIMRDQYRALTSTAAERKRTVAACRALRAQITRFEDKFIKMHGRAPKGASERAPLASTYTQYREWKRAIRADAACRIQALCRGARVRMALRRSADANIARFVSKRFKAPVKTHVGQGRSMDQSLNHLSIPLDIGSGDSDSPLPRTRLETRTGQRGEDSVEVVINPGTPNPSGSSPPASSTSPNWRNRQPRRQQQQSGGGTSARSSSGRGRGSSLPDVTVMSLAELQQRKRELKQQLKQYDMNFHAQHGRMPEKREKEPIRHLYESYNAYKNQISTIEKGEAQPGPGTAAFRGTVISPSDSPSASPTFNSGSLTPPFSDGHSKKATDISVDSRSEDGVESSTGGASQDLASLKAEKATLHQMLRSYEKDFFKEHKRQVSSFADIRPVASQYRRYKEIKKAIASLS